MFIVNYGYSNLDSEWRQLAKKMCGRTTYTKTVNDLQVPQPFGEPTGTTEYIYDKK